MHYLRFLRCLRDREFEGAMDSLHRYFDYSLRHPGAGPSRPSARTNMAVLPYALLNLAVLHHRFGQLSHTAQANSEPSLEPFIFGNYVFK